MARFFFPSLSPFNIQAGCVGLAGCAALVGCTGGDDDDTAGEDTTPPAVTITEPQDGAEIGCTVVTVRGTAEDPSGVAQVSVNGVLATSLSEGFATWEVQVPVAAGPVALSVTAEDTSGNVGADLAQAQVTVIDPTALSLDLVSGRLYGTVTLDGTELFDADSAYYIIVRDPDEGHDAQVGYYATSPNWQLTVLQGEYDVLIEPDAGIVGDSSVLVEPLLVASRLAVGEETLLDIPLTRATVHGDITVDGAPLGSGNGVGYQVGLVEPGKEPFHFLSFPSGETAYTLHTLSGTWDVWFKFPYGFFGPSTPEVAVKAAAGAVLEGDTTLPLELDLATVTGSLGVDGASLFGGVLTFTDSTSGRSYSYSVSGTSYTAMVPSGTYDVSLTTAEQVLGGDYYSTYHPVGVVSLGTGLDLGGAETLDIHLTTATLSGTVTLDGSAPSSPTGIWYTVRLQDPVSGSSISVDFQMSSNYFSMIALQGTWDVWVSLPAGTLDDGLHELVIPTLGAASVEVSGNAEVVLPLTSAMVTGSVDLDGSPLSSAPDHGFRIQVYDQADASRQAASTFTGVSGAYELSAHPGNYHAWVVVDDYLLGGDGGALVLPRPLGALVVGEGTTTFPIDLVSADVGGTVTLDGVALSSSPGYLWTVSLVDPAWDPAWESRVELEYPASSGQFMTRALSGSYDLWLTLPEEVFGGSAAILPRKLRTGLQLCGE